MSATDQKRNGSCDTLPYKQLPENRAYFPNELVSEKARDCLLPLYDPFHSHLLRIPPCYQSVFEKGRHKRNDCSLHCSGYLMFGLSRNMTKFNFGLLFEGIVLDLITYIILLPSK